jgi:hypothetical protein
VVAVVAVETRLTKKMDRKGVVAMERTSEHDNVHDKWQGNRMA